MLSTAAAAAAASSVGCRAPLLRLRPWSLRQLSGVLSVSRRWAATQADGGRKRVKTGIVMLNMGGPERATEEDVGGFLHNLFADSDIIHLGKWQSTLGRFIARRRTPAVTEQYKEIDGSPIRKWTEHQGREMVRLLDEMSPDTAPHQFYVGFRYVEPSSRAALQRMKADGVQRAVAFSQYPHYSCTTTGSSLNDLWRHVREQDMEQDFQWSIIDRWPTHPTFVDAVTRRIEMGMQQFNFDQAQCSPDDVVVLFSAHSLPMRVVERGDAYPQEVGATVEAVMNRVREKLGFQSPYLLSWQSKVGPLPWLGPQTGDVLKGLKARHQSGEANNPCVLVVPIAFTSDHIETLFEIDLEYKPMVDDVLQFVRAPSLNDEPLLSQAQAEIVAEHLRSGRAVQSNRYKMQCPMCVSPTRCRSIVNPISQSL